MKYQKKPLIIEAIRFNGPDSIREMRAAWGEPFDKVITAGDAAIGLMPPSTLEGLMGCCMGDWMIKGIEGEFYSCRNSVFEASYEMPQEAQPEPPIADEPVSTEERADRENRE